MITRNFMGKIEPQMENKRKENYIVQKEWDGWRIVKQMPLYRVNAVVIDNPWNDIGPFDSMVKAYAYLKMHVDELL